MKVTFIMPAIGKKSDEPYVRSWQMEPLAIAVLCAYTPSKVERCFYDDRLEPINYDDDTDLVAINVETYTAYRAYQIAKQYQQKNVPVVMGGFHPTMVPDEVENYADAIVVGEAEGVWEQLLKDAAAGTLKKRYQAPCRPSLTNIAPDRSIFQNKKYIPLTLMETGRGCCYSCNFCSISAFYGKTHNCRPVESIIQEIKTASKKNIFFIDDNIAMNASYSKQLFKALIPLKKRWVSQISINLACDQELVSLMQKSGCAGVLIGFESLEEDNLAAMHKGINTKEDVYEKGLQRLRQAGLAVYGTFVFGYDADTEKTFEKTLAFAKRHRFFLTAFNHLVPFPGTPLYKELKQEGRLIYDKWWLNPEYRFGQLVFNPRHMKAETLANRCEAYRHKFYSFSSIMYRAMDLKANLRSFPLALIYFTQNFMARREVALRQNLPLGNREEYHA
ncbi:MAG: B12-binding domain-containing radical SAM protein [Fibrobacteria bacterium]|nr:B12-binding domain-containing radical SAM protein [Fibrobacteria bacterium]